MKKYLAAACAAIALAGPAAADPAEGMWQTEPDDGAYAHVKMVPCGEGQVCGVIARTFNASGEYQSPNLGKTLVIGMTPEGNGHYKGRVWRPSNGKIYHGKMDLSGDRLELRGCIAGGLLCSSQDWVRLQ
ncbi:DUF2147 domain-containing protein [Tranquillimonas alkanivorans]|uniref:Uncharacterized conserved protein, DUF2147 family n=1 Tax=Tranquillimonas alkanivorans TaxID=441119 RepID=A0A1I5SKQ7_9RHOB|nr:DUF2147 domain-containing protein [Tranquillimonas alkanivorans]SFP71087.1 Uncharacterized conserved protein, DUF2147 family [Tranquillimonas alkanivorans]